MEHNNNNNNNNNNNFITILEKFIIIFGAIIIITLAILLDSYLFKKEKHEILNITNDKIIYQIDNNILIKDIDTIKITIDNSIDKPILITDNFLHIELLINEKDFNKYLNGTLSAGQ